MEKSAGFRYKTDTGEAGRNFFHETRISAP